MDDVLTLDRPAEGRRSAAGRDPVDETPQWESVVPDAVAGLWPQVGPMIHRSREWSPTAQKLESMDDIRQRLGAGHYVLWICVLGGKIIAALVMRMTQHARCKVVDIVYGAGEQMLKWLKPFHEKIVADARADGCRFIRATGRSKWRAALKRSGYQEVSTVFAMEI